MAQETKHLTAEQLQIIQTSIKNILKALGDNPEREGLLETPERVARMFDEVFEGLRYTNEEIAELCGKCFSSPDSEQAHRMITMTDIDAFSYCEHHMALMYNMRVNVAYVPNGRIIGLSKIARVVDLVTKRLQLQEKIGSDVADVLSMILNTKDVMVVITGEHACMTTRGIRKPGTVTKTICARGAFENNAELRMEFLGLLKD